MTYLVWKRRRYSKPSTETPRILPELDNVTHADSEDRAKISLQSRPAEMAQEREPQELNAEQRNELPG